MDRCACVELDPRVVALVAIATAILGGLRLALVIAFACQHGRREARRAGVDWKPPSLAVLVPAYNEEKVICATIRSLLSSDGADLDIIVVDDGSSDRTAEIARRAFSDDIPAAGLQEGEWRQSRSPEFRAPAHERRGRRCHRCRYGPRRGRDPASGSPFRGYCHGRGCGNRRRGKSDHADGSVSGLGIRDQSKSRPTRLRVLQCHRGRTRRNRCMAA